MDSKVLTTVAAGTPEVMDWQVQLGGRHASRRWVVVALAILTVPLGWVLLQNLLLALLGPVVIMIATADLFLPIRYQINAKGVTSKCGLAVTEIEWSGVKSLRKQPDGIVVSPLEGDSRLDAFRGVYLRFDGNESEVLAKIGEFWSEHEGILGTGTDGGADIQNGG